MLEFSLSSVSIRSVVSLIFRCHFSFLPLFPVITKRSSHSSSFFVHKRNMLQCSVSIKSKEDNFFTLFPLVILLVSLSLLLSRALLADSYVSN